MRPRMTFRKSSWPVAASRLEISVPSFGDAALLRLIRGIAETNDEFAADPLADRRQHIHREAQPVFQRVGAVRPAQIIGQRRPELVQQMAVDLQLDPVHSAGLHPLCRIGEICDDPFDIPVLDQLGERAVRRFPVPGG